MALRLGVSCAAFDADGSILLSQRGDLGIWNLPSGRLDYGETLSHGAAREVREETGIEVRIERCVGLYFIEGQSRLNVLFRASVVGGQLLQRTPETRANRFFASDALPNNIVPWHRDYVSHSLDGRTHLAIIRRPASELRRIRRQLAWRWFVNLLSGHPEPRWPHFKIYTAWENVPDVRVLCDEHTAPWEALLRAKPIDAMVGFVFMRVIEDIEHKTFVFIFAPTFDEESSDDRHTID